MKLKENIWCRFGWHTWYKGCFSYPEWGRYERHCIDCGLKQYSKWDKFKGKVKQFWITF